MHDGGPVVPSSDMFRLKVRDANATGESDWRSITTYATNVAEVNLLGNEFTKHPIAVASLEMQEEQRLQLQVQHTQAISSAVIRPLSLGIQATVHDGTITFELPRSVDVMLELNDNKWEALHILANVVDKQAPKEDTENTWYFGPGINNGRAFSKAVDFNISVPSNTSVYLDAGAFVTAKFIFDGVSNSSIRGPGFILKEIVSHPASFHPRELAEAAILIERSENIVVESVTSLGAKGFSLPVCQSKNIHINRYRSFSSAGNGDGIDLFCCRDITIENCFLRNSDDTIAIYGHRWNYYGDTSNIEIRDCTFLPDLAHPIQVGTHGNPADPETLSDIRVRNIDILDHHENQMWYQGCISLNAGDDNLIEDVVVEDIRVERISKGQLVNIRVMKNAMWTTSPGRGVRNVVLRNIELDMERSRIVNPSQILGLDASRRVENVTFENLKIGGKKIHDGMPKPRWYMVSDLVPMFVNEHVASVKFSE